MTLNDIQVQFQTYLLEGDRNIESKIIQNDHVSSEIRLKIYYDAYRIRLMKALKENFPIVERCIGRDQFQEIAAEYIRHHPSSFRSIRWFGNQFPHFLNQYEHESAAFLAELALFEWTHTLVCDASDDETLRIEDMTALSPEQWLEWQFDFHASVHHMELSWNVPHVWQSIYDEQHPSISRLLSKTDWVMWRKNQENHYCLLESNEAYAFRCARNKMTFGEWCLALCTVFSEEEAGRKAANFLKKWIQSGWIFKQSC